MTETTTRDPRVEPRLHDVIELDGEPYQIVGFDGWGVWLNRTDWIIHAAPCDYAIARKYWAEITAGEKVLFVAEDEGV